MPVPKRKVSKARKRKRRTHKKLTTPNLSICPKCKSPKLPHRPCFYCGVYKEEKILETVE